jgi:formylglycine-generating enzyme required for sulfatase activity/serine/threonine protein kinase
MSIQSLTGYTFGQYELRELLGAGGMGAVYRAYQASLKRYVAVKVLSAQLAEQPDYIARFLREAETSAALEHPHIVPVHDYGTQQTISYVVMRLLTGGSLAERVAQRRDSAQPLPSLGEIAELLRQLAGALDYAHSQGVIHRDIKLSNVMFDNYGNAYLVDFGIAKLLHETASLTASGAVIGTWGYMAPEQWRAETLTPATDQYALGVMVYALVTGRLPFEAPTPAGIMHKHLNEMPTPPYAYRPDVPPALTAVLERAMAKKAEDRFPTCTAFAQAFDSAIRGQTGEVTDYFTAPLKRRPAPVAGTRVSAPDYPPTATRPIYRHPAMWVMGAALVVAAIVIAFLLFGGGEKAKSPATPAPGVAVVATETETLTPTITAAPGETVTPSPTPTATPTMPAIQTIQTDTPTSEPTSTPTDTETSTFTPMPTETAPLTLTVTPTLPPTLSEDEKEATIQAQIEEMLTLTATQWTPTPTPSYTPTEDLAATAQARLEQTETQQASDWIMTQTQMVLDLTATAAAWTPTPTPTATATVTPTYTITPSPAPAPTLIAGAPEEAFFPAGSSNRAWTPVIQDFDGVEMVLVPAGCFMMGSESGNDDEKPVHEVCFDQPFWIDRTEVTNAQYGSSGYFAGDSYPRDRVTWFEAQGFCESRGARLPTEAEWEYAARGPERWLYPWGNEFIAENVVYYDNSGGQVSRVGSAPGGASWVGALDMSGNVWEWTSTIYDQQHFPYPYIPDDGRENSEDTTTARVKRGGSWAMVEKDVRTTIRHSFLPSTNDWTVGFRCARSADQAAQPATPAEPTLVAAAPETAYFPAGASNRAWRPYIQDFDGVEMVRAPAGCFMMGSDDGYLNEKPAHRVCFDDPYWIDQTEVTNGQFAAFNGQAESSSYFSGDDRPREEITWTEAQAFCESRGARLPTEAEWEYAARGPEAWEYPWGDDFDGNKIAWNRDTSEGSASVGSLPAGASWVGALDMSGNVWEWVADWADWQLWDVGYYASLEDGAINPTGPASGEYRVLRGGSWGYGATVLYRAAFRDFKMPVTREYDIGFRCARSDNETAPQPVAPAEPTPVAAAPEEAFFPAGSSNRAWTPVIQNFDGVEMVLVPAGCFMMGSTDEQVEAAFELCEAERGPGQCDRSWFYNEQPAHEVCLDAFWIDQTEVTNAQYRACVEAGACTPPGHRTHYDDPSYADHPVVYVTWFQANTYAAWIGGRLPTEAEWEYTAGGPEGWTYPWGNEATPCERANVSIRGSYCTGGTLPVGSYPNGASWVGALDMSGNVWEWVSSIYLPYPYDAADGRENNADTGGQRVFRGGAWGYNQGDSRSEVRYRTAPTNSDTGGGFRCARSY